MSTIYFNSTAGDEFRRDALYNGAIFVYAPRPTTQEFCAFARELIEDAFGAVDPRKAQDCLPVEKCVEILAILKPKFIHHPKSKEYLRLILEESGCDLSKTYFDVPRLRSAFAPEYLASGIAYAFHPHRDTWYSAPPCQLNWWIPVYDITPENCLAFHPQYWSEPVRNSSRTYNYAEWNKTSRKDAARHIKQDTRVQPRPEEPMQPDPQQRIICDVGGTILFSAAQMHSTVPNTSGVARFSIDFRTVHVDDVWARRGAPNIDSECTGTTMRDYLRGSDLSHIPEEAVALYEGGGTAAQAAGS